MGKLNIAHHKSYHPYRRDNIEKVRKDEEEARLQEEREEGRMMLADSEARIDRLRERAGVADKPNKKKRKDDDLADLPAGGSMKVAVLPTTGGHINFFEDLEHNAIAAAVKATKKAEPKETEKGVPLAPTAKDLKPWYSSRTNDEDQEDVSDARRKRDLARQSLHDPLISITKQLASHASSSSSSSNPKFQSRLHQRSLPSSTSTTRPPELNARLTRESSERERALELIRRKKREMQGSETPSTVYGGLDGGYGDVFNRREVEEAHRGRDRRWDRGDRSWKEDDRSRRHSDGRGRERMW